MGALKDEDARRVKEGVVGGNDSKLVLGILSRFGVVDGVAILIGQPAAYGSKQGIGRSNIPKRGPRFREEPERLVLGPYQ